MTAPRRPDLAEAIRRRAEADQRVRRFAIEARKPTDEEWAHARETDRDNTAWLAQLVDEHGWPGIELVGQPASHDAWLLAQHADAQPQLQRRWLTLLRKAVEVGDAQRSCLAYLQDRVAVHSGQPQRHGTQWTRIDGVNRLAALADPDKVNQWRDACSLEPLTAEEIAEAHRPDDPRR